MKDLIKAIFQLDVPKWIKRVFINYFETDKDNINTINSEIASIRSRNSKQDNSISSINSGMSSIKSKISKQDSSISSINSEIFSIKSRLDALEAKQLWKKI